MLHLLYAAGLRISEVIGLRWRELTERDGAGHASVLGKGVEGPRHSTAGIPPA